MRVLHILNDVTDQGNGIVNTAVDLAAEQARTGVPVAVISDGGGYQPLLERAGATHITLNQTRRPLQLLRAVIQFGKILREFQPDVVHAHMRTGLLLAWVWRRFRRFVLVGHVHNVHDRSSILMGLADRIIVVSQSVAATMEGQGIAPHKIRVVLNRTLQNQRQPQLDEIQPVQLQHPAIVTVAGMTSRKGIAELIEAFESVGRKFPTAHLYLVGDGPERNIFEQRAQQSLFHDRIHFEGFQAVPQAYMLSADVFVLASRRESFGLVLIEARQTGCAIVATNVDGISEALDDGRAGVMVPPQSPEALARAISSLIGSEDERDAWRKQALNGIEDYRVSVMAGEVQSVYEELSLSPNIDTGSNVVWQK